MEATFKRTFVKDLQKLPQEIKERIKTFALEQSVEAGTIHELGKITKISGYSDYYRKRFGDYRVSFKLEERKIVFYRALHRREIYRYFP